MPRRPGSRAGGATGSSPGSRTARSPTPSRDLGLPTVDLRGLLTDLEVPLFTTDDAAVSPTWRSSISWSGGSATSPSAASPAPTTPTTARACFAALVEEAGFACHVYQPVRKAPAGGTDGAGSRGAGRPKARCAQWIEALPKPVGLMACNDIRGQQVLNACRDVEIAVPEDVAVLGVDNDDVLCDLSYPTLSERRPRHPPHRLRGRGPARTDDAAASRRPQTTTLIPPLGVVTRRSTDVLAIEDRHLALPSASSASTPARGSPSRMSWPDIPLSRSVFERRFARSSATAQGRDPPDAGSIASSNCSPRPSCPSSRSPPRSASSTRNTSTSSSRNRPARPPASIAGPRKRGRKGRIPAVPGRLPSGDGLCSPRPSSRALCPPLPSQGQRPWWARTSVRPASRARTWRGRLGGLGLRAAALAGSDLARGRLGGLGRGRLRGVGGLAPGRDGLAHLLEVIGRDRPDGQVGRERQALGEVLGGGVGQARLELADGHVELPGRLPIQAVGDAPGTGWSPASARRG